MNRQLADLYHRHAVASFDKQLHLSELVAELDWHFEMATGRLAFGQRFCWRVQLLGTESTATQTWLWAWANRESRIPPNLLRSVQFVKAMGDLLNLAELTEPDFSLGETDGHFLAALCCGVCQASAYYRLPYEGGALFVLVVDEDFPRRMEPVLARMVTVFPQALQSLPLHDHRTAWDGYLRFYGLQSTEAGEEIRTGTEGEGTLIASFDDKRRLLRLEGTIASGRKTAEETAAKGPAMPSARGRKLIIAFGPEMPGWGSWDWIGADLLEELAGSYQTVSFRGQAIPDCDVLIVVKHALDPDVVERAARKMAVLYCPVDAYGSHEEIAADGLMLRRCACIVLQCERLRRYFEPYAPVEYMDHHVKFTAPPGEHFLAEGPILWVGVRTNLPPLVEWVNAHPLPCDLLVLTNPEVPRKMPSAQDFGFHCGLAVTAQEWSPQAHREALVRCRAALDVKGSDFRALHKPPAKAIDFLASGLPLAMNADSSPVEHLARLGFEIAPLHDRERWLSRDYWEETRRFGAVLRELLSRERIGHRWKRLIDEVLAGRLGK
jgi:hypothetical protein